MSAMAVHQRLSSSVGPRRLCDYSLADENFRRRLCQILGSATSFLYGPALLSALHRRPGESVDRFYERSLRRNFGQADLESSPIQFAELAPRIRERTMPFPIMNATVADLRRYPSWSSRLIEFTPAGRGNADFGYRAWGAELLAINRIAAISGAAQAPLRQTTSVL